MTPLRIGMIGMGFMNTGTHPRALKPLIDAGEVVLQAFCDVDPDVVREQGEKFGVANTYTNHHDMFAAESLDAVYLCIPPTLHTDEVTEAAKRGIHLLVEKPPSLDMQQALTFSKQIQQAGIVSQVGYMSRYFESARIVKDLLADRTPRHAVIQMFYSGAHVRYWTSRYELCGGSFVENTIHYVDLLRYFLGDIQKVSAFYQFRQPGEGPEPINLPHVYNVNYQLASGVVANATTSRVLTNTDTSRRALNIICDDALIEWDAGKVTLNDETVWETPEPPNPSGKQTRAFIDAVRAADPARPLSPYAEGMNSLAAVLAANASAEAGGPLIDLDDFMNPD